MPYYILRDGHFHCVSRSTWKRYNGRKKFDTLPVNDAINNDEAEKCLSEGNDEGSDIVQDEIHISENVITIDEMCSTPAEISENNIDSSQSEISSIFDNIDDDDNTISDSNSSSHTISPHLQDIDLFGPNARAPSDYEGKSLLHVLLAKWAVKRKITQESGRELLHILKDPKTDLLSLAKLPLSLQTLKKIPRSKLPFLPEIKKIGGGEYAYLGIETNLSNKKANFFNHQKDIIRLAFNTDGVKIIDSAPSYLWPILGQCHGCRVFLIALFHGETKPNNFNEFFHDFVEETKYLKKKYGSKFEVFFFTADTPAKASSLNIKGPNGFFSCPKCEIPGERSYKEVGGDKEEKPAIKKRKLEPEEDADDEGRKSVAKKKKKKTIKSSIYFVGEKYRKRRHADYEKILPNTPKKKDSDPKLIFHHGFTKLQEIPDFDLVKDVVIDIQHAGYLNAMKKLAEYYTIGYCVFGGKSTNRRSLIGNKNVTSLSKDLEDLHKWCPTEFARKPRKITMLCDWKTTELRQFLEYSGMVLLKKYLPEEHYTCFKTLAIAMRVLNMEEEVSKDRTKHAKSLIKYFLQQCAELYGPEFITHSIHILNHLPDDCLRFQTTAVALSCLAFENFNFELSSSVKSGYLPLQQVINRYNEYVYWSKYSQNDEVTDEDPKNQLRIGNYIFRCDRDGDSFCSIHSDSRLFKIVSFSGTVIRAREFETVEPIFLLPDDSRYYGYYKCKNLSTISTSLNTEDITGKFYAIPSNKPDTFTLIKLQHAF